MTSISGYNLGVCGGGLATPPRGQSTFFRKVIIMASVPPFTGVTAGRTPWTPEEDALLRLLHPNHTIQQLSELIARTPGAIKSRCGILGLRKLLKWTPELFLSVVIKQENGCWIWPLNSPDKPYGEMWVNGKCIKAHVYAYEVVAGHKKTKSDLHHTCENKRCVNPNHLQNLTALEHSAVTPSSPAYINRNKTHCKRGHEFNALNTQVRRFKSGIIRECRECKRIWARAHWGKKQP